MLKVLFVSSANKNGISPIVRAQGESIKALGLTIEYYGITGKGAIGYLKNISGLKRAIKKTNPDVIHAHYSLSGIVAGLSTSKIPVIVSLMGSDTKSGALLKTVTAFFSKYFWRQVIIKSSSMQVYNNPDNLKIIPNGVDINHFKPLNDPSLKKKFSFSDDKLTMLFLADPERHSKNFTLAQEAFKSIPEDLAELQVRCDLPHDQIPEVLNAADIILLTSRWEGSPNVVKEAMACNCPVVSTDVGDVSSLFGNEPGYYLTTSETKDVVLGIKKAIKFSLNTGRTNGRERIKALKLDSESVARRIITLYLEAAGKNIKTRT